MDHFYREDHYDYYEEPLDAPEEQEEDDQDHGLTPSERNPSMLRWLIHQSPSGLSWFHSALCYTKSTANKTAVNPTNQHNGKVQQQCCFHIWELIWKPNQCRQFPLFCEWPLQRARSWMPCSYRNERHLYPYWWMVQDSSSLCFQENPICGNQWISHCADERKCKY